MKKLLISFIVIIISLFSFFPDEKHKFVDSFSGLILRENSTSSSKKLSLIPYGEEVLVLEKGETKQTISGETDFWYNVKWNKFTGWCFGGFLTDEENKLYDEEYFKFLVKEAWSRLYNVSYYFSDSNMYNLIKPKLQNKDDVYKYLENYFDESFIEIESKYFEAGMKGVFGGWGASHGILASKKYWLSDKNENEVVISSIETEYMGTDDITVLYIFHKYGNLWKIYKKKDVK
jgi:hypothetical protein